MGEMHNAISQGSPPGAQQRLSTGLYQSGVGLPNLEEELSIDKNTMETLKALYAAKERAV